jgi:hypothetical protein
MADIITKRVDTITMTSHISEEELRDRLLAEFLIQTKMCDPQGHPLPGVKTSIRRGAGKQGGYTMTAQLDNQAAALIEGPK